MNASTKAEQTALTLPQRAAVALGAADHEVKLRALLANSARIVAPANKDARDECHAAYMVLKNTRIAITKAEGEATEDAKAFTKAVKAEAARLLGITEAEETRLQGLRDDFDAKVQAEKDAKIKAERDRMDAIRAKIEAMRAIPTGLIGKSAAEIHAVIERIAAEPFDLAGFAELAEEALAVNANVATTLASMYEGAKLAEAEAARLAAERAELARLRAESEARRVDDERNAAQAKAAQDAERAEADRLRAIEDEKRQQAIRDQQAVIDKQNEQLRQDAEAVRLEREKFAAEQKAIADAEAKPLADIAAAEESEAERVRLQAAADQALADGREDKVVTILDNDEPATAKAPASPWPFPFRARPADSEIIEVVAQHFSVATVTALEWLVEVRG